MIRLIYGTRPEAVKLYPVVRALRQRGITQQVVFTGQHPDLIRGLELEPDIRLDMPGNNDPEAYVTALMSELHGRFSDRPDLVMVQGDTASALTGARYGVGIDTPVAHVEAGLRSHHDDDPWPEERFRMEIDHLSTLRYAPTVTSLGNLLAENLQHGSVVTGNTVVDALRLAGVSRGTPGPQVLVTLHRREAFGEASRACTREIEALARANPHMSFLWPAHPNPRAARPLPDSPVLLREPLDYVPFLRELAVSRIVITDSGGLIEECATLGVPCLVCRDVTERPEAVRAGYATLVGRDGHGLLGAFDGALRTTLNPSMMFGDGYAADRIADLLMGL